MSIENPDIKPNGFVLSDIVKRKILNTYKISKNSRLQSSNEEKDFKSVKIDSNSN